MLRDVLSHERSILCICSVQLDKIAAYDLEREAKRELLRHTSDKSEEEIEKETMEALPDRDWDAEEEEEDEERSERVPCVRLFVSTSPRARKLLG